MNILTKALRKAPFPIDDAIAIRNLKAKTAKTDHLGGDERLPFNAIFGGLDGNIRRHTGSNEYTYGVYYFLAESFGWDKIQVDKLPAKYIKGLLWMNKKQAEELTIKMSLKALQRIGKMQQYLVMQQGNLRKLLSR